MDAVNEAGDPGGAEAALRAAEAELERAEQFARIDNDPTAHSFHALRLFLGAIATLIADQRRSAAAHRQSVDRDFDLIRQARDSVADTARQAVIAAKAEVEAAHADMARQFAASIARSAEQHLATMARGLWWRTLALGSSLAIIILALGFGGGYWRGHAAGYHQAATSIRASAPVEQAVLTAQGPAALRQWHRLMRDNAILATLKTDCTEQNTARQNGRTACHLWLWTTPYIAPAAHG